MLVPWDDLTSVNSMILDRGTGRHGVDIRTVITALIIKHRLCLDVIVGTLEYQK